MGSSNHRRQNDELDVLHQHFTNPPAGYGEVSFFWWLGDALTKERLTWQLEQLKDKHIEGLQVNYAHSDKGGHAWGLTYESDPPLFSEAWWDLYIWFLQEAKARGMAVSLSDYTLCTPGQGFYTDEVIRNNPGIHGSVLKHEVSFVKAGDFHLISGDDANSGKTLDAEPGPDRRTTLSLVAYDRSHEQAGELPSVDLLGIARSGAAQWLAPEGDWMVVHVYSEPRMPSIDFMNPLAGKEIIHEFFQKFEDRIPDEAGRGLNYFFSDELFFNISGNMWNSVFADAFIQRKGYDVTPHLAALFADIGTMTQKIRLDYKDVLVQLEEENYFKPVFDWHEARGMTYGCDHGGRGRDVTEFGDYFRTQKWNQGPGNDQPMLASDIIKNKVSSSIAHMYERPRVWLEGFYSSGWGTSSGALADATFRNFAMGHNLLTLHGLYYSTQGGWWEWAPPCNHFRMPYWEHMGEFLHCTNRLSYLLSQGVHVCDVAIVYPVAAVEGGLDGEASVQAAFAAGEHLYGSCLDFDFIDFQSIERAVIEGNELLVAGECFKVLVLPSMKTVRFGMMQKLLDFHRAGGKVLCLGALPEASDRAGRKDPLLDGMVREMFSQGENHVATVAEAAERIRKWIQPDVSFAHATPENPIHVLHRRIGSKEVYLVYGASKGSPGIFRATGDVELWNPWTAEAARLAPLSQTDGVTTLAMPLDAKDLHLLVFDASTPSTAEFLHPTELVTEMALDGTWDLALIPTMDNRFGDFRLPAFDDFIGVEIRKLAYAWDDESASGEEDIAHAAGLDDEACPRDEAVWHEVRCGYGPRFMKLGPVLDGADLNAFEAVLLREDRISGESEYHIRDCVAKFSPYEYSERMCVEGDPGHQGYHGLKGEMSDEFLIMGKPTFTHTSTIYSPEETGDIYYFWTTVSAYKKEVAKLKTGGFEPLTIWVNGTEVAFTGAHAPNVALCQGINRILLKYKGVGRGFFILESTEAPEDWKQTFPLAMTWYRKPGVYRFDAFPSETRRCGRYRFTSAPGLKELVLNAYGDVQMWVDGTPAVKTASRDLGNGVTEHAFCVERMRKDCSLVEMRIIHEKGLYGGAALPDPIRMKTVEGVTELGDWSKTEGLHSYSGGARYKKQFTLPEGVLREAAHGEHAIPENASMKERRACRILLDLGEVVSTAELKVNGMSQGIKVAPSWVFDITHAVKPGSNLVEVVVYNTLGNHYTSIPTRYPGKLDSGLVGPVTLRVERYMDHGSDAHPGHANPHTAKP